MRHRIMDILLVSTPYDTFILEEAGELSERMLGEFRNLDLHYSPGLTGISTGTEALRIARENHRVNLIITTPHLADMDAAELARRIQAEGLDVPVVLLAWDTRELADFQARKDTSAIERSFLWQGDARILVSIVKSVEDWRNAEHDTRRGGRAGHPPRRGQRPLLLVLPARDVHGAAAPLAAGHRRGAEPLAEDPADAGAAEDPPLHDLGGGRGGLPRLRRGGARASSPTSSSRARGRRSPRARAPTSPAQVRAAYPDVPIILHSSRPENEALARSVGADFLLKGSPLLLQELRDVMLRALRLRRLRRSAGRTGPRWAAPPTCGASRSSSPPCRRSRSSTTPAATTSPAGSRPAPSSTSPTSCARGRSTTTRARRRCARASSGAIAAYRLEQSRTLVTDFDRDDFDLSRRLLPDGRAARSAARRAASPSCGGCWPSRACATASRTSRSRCRSRPCSAPTSSTASSTTTTCATSRSSARTTRRSSARFRAAPFPEEAERDVAAFLERATWPLAVRSSSLLEDSQHQPFTGVYDTLMLPNNSLEPRASGSSAAILAIKRVYASTFSQHAKAYLRATPYRLEEEKMAVILQRIVGAPRGRRGSTRTSPGSPARTTSTRRRPWRRGTGSWRSRSAWAARSSRAAPASASARATRGTSSSSPPSTDMLETTQREFWALPLEGGTADGGMREESFDLAAAEADGALAGASPRPTRPRTTPSTTGSRARGRGS